MPSLRHSSATLSSPRSPAITILTFSSAEYCRRVARRISRTAFSASSECRSTADLISAPSAVTMSSNLSLPQSHQSVQLVLTGNNDVSLLTQLNPVLIMTKTAHQTLLIFLLRFRVDFLPNGVIIAERNGLRSRINEYGEEFSRMGKRTLL